MKGIVFIALIALLIHFSLQTCNNVTVSDGDKVSACSIYTGTDSAAISPEERQEYGWTYCCLHISSNRKYCTGVTDDQFANMKKYKKYLEEFVDSDIDEIKCGSNYLSYSLFVITFFVLIF